VAHAKRGAANNGIGVGKTREIIKFFRDYGFMIIDEKERIKLDEGFRKFLIQTSL
jgi:hypothetical protein